MIDFLPGASMNVAPPNCCCVCNCNSHCSDIPSMGGGSYFDGYTDGDDNSHGEVVE